MNKKLTVVQIIQGNNRGTVQFTEVDEAKKTIPGSVVMAIQFTDPAEASTFEHGKQYTVTITKTK